MSSENYFQFEPKMHDFGDAYHLSDEEVYASIDEAVRNIRRKYRTYNEYSKALIVIEKYLDGLIERYGGLKNFKIAIQLGTIREYIPPIPKFRKTEENKLLSKFGVILSDKVFEVSYEIDDEMTQRIENSSEDFGEGYEVIRKKSAPPFMISSKDMKAMNEAEDIAQDLELLTKFSQDQILKGGDMSKKTHKNLSKALRSRRKSLLKCQYKETIVDMFKDYNDGVLGKHDGDDDSSETIYYKGILIPRGEMENAEISASLQAASLIPKDDFSNIRNKKLRKMVQKNRESKKGKKKGKKKNAMDKFVGDYIDSDISSFDAFENEMLNFSSDKIRSLD